MLRSFTICTPHQTLQYLGDQITKNKMGRPCDLYWGEKMCIQGFVVLSLMQREYLEGLDLDGRAIKWILRK